MLYLYISKTCLLGRGEGAPVPFTFVKWGWFTFVKRKFFLMVKVVGSFIIADEKIKTHSIGINKKNNFNLTGANKV